MRKKNVERKIDIMKLKKKLDEKKERGVELKRKKGGLNNEGKRKRRVKNR